jgi:amino acid adenylation domain-containing protein/thioester reductase-like protein/non-ribosomal peptide synthase protein (TIGR01720 family)
MLKSFSSVITLFDHHARHNEDETAIFHMHRSYSYREVNQRANQIAHYLRSLGIKKGEVVAIALPRSPEMLISILGVLKAGGAYLAFDLKYPSSRLRYMLHDSGAVALIGNRDASKDLTDFTGHLIDIHNTSIVTQVTDNLEEEITDDQLAYILYTSGSTGQPKGVMIAHAALSNYVHFASHTYAVHAGKNGSILHSSIAFDLTITSLYVPLVRGETVYLMEEDATIEDLADAIVQFPAMQLLKITPSHLKALNTFLDVKALNNFTLVIGGEDLLTNDIAPWLEAENIHIYNEYGPTEATVGCIIYRATHKDLEHHTVPIGHPIQNTLIYLLDPNLQPVAPGQIGEIYISGAGLAQGYLKQESLTHEKFFMNPFQSQEEETLGIYTHIYRTGDLAKYLPDRNLLFLGRKDHQVKVNGFRIELSEIEAIIHSHDDVNACYVRAITTAQSTKVIAYIVPGDFTPTDTEIKEFLQTKLPSYMIPSILIFVEHIPLTLNGKVDTDALPLPEVFNPFKASQQDHVPCLPLEQQLKDIWMEVLKIPSLNVDDNFYRIGGDSIISLQLVAKARQKGLYFKVQDLFAHPTIRALAQVVKVKQDEIPAHYYFDTDIIPLSPIQRWFFQHDFSNKNHFNQAILLKSNRALEQEKLQQALDAIIVHHPSLQFSFFQDVSGMWYQRANRVPKPVAMEVVELANLTTTEAEQAIAMYSRNIQKGFDIATGNLVKVVMFYIKPIDTYYILIVIHHLVVDTVSWRILAADLEQSYQPFLEGHTNVSLPETSSYQYWVHSLLQYSHSAEIEAERKYWRDVETQILPLAEDHANGPLSYQHTDRVRVLLSQHETLSLLHQVNQTYRTQINDILVTALILAIGDFNGQYQLSFCLEGHGREEHIAANADLSHSVGWFTSLFPVNLSIDHPYDISQAIKQVKEHLQTIPKKGIGYGLMHYQHQQTFFHQSKRPNIIFNYLGQWDNVASAEHLFSFTDYLLDECICEINAPFFPIEINAEIKHSILTIAWGYSTNHFQSNTIESIAQNFLSRLRQLIVHCQDPKHFGYTPADFPSANLSQHEIDKNFGHIRDIEDVYPLSPMQFGILFHHLYAPESNNYFVQTLFKIKGLINKDALQHASTQLVAHNPILRTGFIYDGLIEPLQYVQSNITITLHYEDWSDNANNDYQPYLDAFLTSDQAKGFNLACPPLFRIALIKLTPEEYIICCSQHHILLDGWSSSLLLNELFDRYWNAHKGLNDKIIPSRPPYKQYITWQRLKQQQDASAHNFWQHYLESLEDITHLDFKDLVDKTVEIPAYAENSVILSSAESAHLTDFANQHQCTINTVLLAAVALTLKNYISYQELVMGITVSGRDPELNGVEDMMGLLINTLPLRVQPDPSISIEVFLKELQDTVQNIHKHSYLPLAQVQSFAPTDRSLFNVIFVFEKQPLDDVSKARYTDFNIEEFIGIENTEYPLTITVLQGDHLEIMFNYQTSLFSEAFTSRMLKNIFHVLQQIKQSPKRMIGEIDILDSEEKQFVGSNWSSSKPITPRQLTLSELFEAQAELTPDNIAVICKGTPFTYAELNAKANQLAHYLRTQHVKRETPVVIFCERSFEMIIALMATLKAGGTYIPIDPHYPQETLLHILTDSQAKLLLTYYHLKDVLPTMDVTIVDIEQALNQFPTHNISVVHDADSLAYIIYTSGSTGKPKGVMIEHGNICKRLVGYQDYFPLTANDRVLCQTSISFDVFLAEVFWPFSVGAAIVLSTERGAAHLLELEDLIYSHHVTFAQFVPSVLKLFLAHVDTSKRYHLRGICSGGEILEYKLVEECRQKLPGLKLLNAYGPTETTIDTTIFDCDSLGATPPTFVPIGRSLSNSFAYVVNPSMQLMPVGVIGELCIGGASVARGYLNQPETTRKSFIKNPFLSTPDGSLSRLYKTGDLCRWLENGNLEYIGRRDNQVKIRGFRVELQEIEEVLLQHPYIKDAVVLLKQDSSKNKQLVAFIVASDVQVEIGIIRQWLKHLLPDHMVPSDFVYLEQIPLNANGKVDRKKIAHIKSATNAREVVLPTSHLERQLCDIWQRILNIDNVGIRDNFFLLGGNSISATQLILLIKKEFQHDIPFAVFFNEPTIEHLAKLFSNDGTHNAKTNILQAMLNDIAVANKIMPANDAMPAGVQRDILLTGASGFLGAHLLEVLLHHTTGRIYCLLRGKHIREAKQQFKAKLRYYQLEHLADHERVIPILGDIAEPRLGLDEATYRIITHEVTDIYHNGALVHHIYDYSRLRAANVSSTIEMLKIAGKGLPKAIHYISTLSATMDKNAKGQIAEGFVQNIPVGDEGGYSLSKWTSEKILADAVTRGYACTIHRLPQIMGHSVTGITPNDQTHITLLMKQWIELGIAPKDIGSFEFLPVDFATKSMVAICKARNALNAVYNYGHPTSISFNEMIEWLNEFGYPITLVEKDEWQWRCVTYIQENSALYPLLSLYLDQTDDMTDEADTNYRTAYREDTVVIERYLTILKDNATDLPVIDKALFFKYCQYLHNWFIGDSKP